MSDYLTHAAVAAAHLKTTNPPAFEAFVKALRDYENVCIDALLAAGKEVIVEAQQKAKSARELRTKLENCSSIRDTFEKRK